MTEEQKRAERNKLFEMFTGGGTTVEELFQYLTKFAEEHKDALREKSPFYIPQEQQSLKVTIQGEEALVRFSRLDRMVEYLLSGEEAHRTAYIKKIYIPLRWNNTNDSDSTYKRNIGDIKADAADFRKNHPNISRCILTDAAKEISGRLNDDDKKFWKKVLNMPNTASPAPTTPDPLESAEGIISKAIENAAQKDAIKKCVIFTGAPGTGKTYCVEEYVKKHTGQDKNRWEFVQFHSSYDYTDFVEGLRPIKEGKEMVFVRMDGIFKAFCRRAAADEDKPFYFIIDEINRADLGRVFGELMYCFEKRGEEHKIAMQYANLPAYNKTGKRIYDDCFRDGFYIPGNVVIIGTMNDIDRSVETFDFALRRRFDWVEIEADKVMKSSLVSMEVPTDIVGRIKEMNKIIEDKSGLGKDFKIGPAYFQKYDGSNLKDIWEHNIEPILKEYMRGRQGAKDFIDKCEAALFSKDANA